MFADPADGVDYTTAPQTAYNAATQMYGYTNEQPAEAAAASAGFEGLQQMYSSSSEHQYVQGASAPEAAAASLSGYASYSTNQTADYTMQPAVDTANGYTEYSVDTQYYTAAEQQAPTHSSISNTTVYVGGLPVPSPAEGDDPDSKPKALVDEAALHNFFFSHCGAVKSIRLQAMRGFCFIEFEKEESVAAAISLTGCQTALNPEDPSAVTKLTIKPARERPPKQQDSNSHAHAHYPSHQPPSDPQYSTHSLAPTHYSTYRSQQSHWTPRTRTRTRSASPPRFPEYTESEMRRTKEVLKSSTDQVEFHEMLVRIQRWMEGGSCTKRNVDHFHSALQTIHSRSKAFGDLEEARKREREQEDLEFAHSLVGQCAAMQAAFEAARQQRVHDVMSKTQRKTVEQWSKSVATIHRLFRAASGLAGEEHEEDAGKTAPPPPPVAPPPPAARAPQVDVSGKRKLDEKDARIRELESLLSARDSVVRNLSGRVSELQLQVEAAQPPSPQATVAASPSTDATLTACIMAALSVYLMAHPSGAPLSDLSLYITKLTSPPGSAPLAPAPRSVSIVKDVLTNSPGVFRRTDTGLGQPLWALSAFQSVSALLNSANTTQVEAAAPAAVGTE